MGCSIWKRGGSKIHLRMAGTCLSSGHEGKLGVSRYAHENGCPWNEWTCSVAGEKGQLEVMIYDHANVCPWDENTCTRAKSNGHTDVLEWARQNDCPYDDSDHENELAGSERLQCRRLR
jgi:hypothetical protein